MGNQFKHMAVIACLKTLLFIFTIVFWLNGMFFLIVGVWAEVEMHRYMELSPEFSDTASYVLIGTSCLILLVSSFAFTCIIKGQPVLLYIYGGFLACIFMMDVGFAASMLCYRDTFPKSFRDGLLRRISANDMDSHNLDFAQEHMHCCGVNNYTDWIRLSPQKVIPASCCHDLQKCVTANYSEVYQRGCYEVFVELLENNIDFIAGIAIGAACLPLIGSILSCFLAHNSKRSKYQAVN